MMQYHDNEWGTPLHDENQHFEFLILETMQTGLSWNTILQKRENFRTAFDQFDPSIVAKYDEQKYEELLANKGIIRNKLKIRAAIHNANCFLDVQKEFGSFDQYIWSFTDGKTIVNHSTEQDEIIANSKLSDTVSKDLKKRGFKFVGSTVIYAHLQAIGIIDDHLDSCFRKEK